MEDIEVIHEQKTVGHIYGSILSKYSNLIKLTIINAPKMDNNIITKIDTDDIFNDVYKKEPYFYNDELEIDWGTVLNIINYQEAYIDLYNKQNYKNRKDILYKLFTNIAILNETKIAAIIANYYQMTEIHNIITGFIKRFYNDRQHIESHLTNDSDNDSNDDSNDDSDNDSNDDSDDDSDNDSNDDSNDDSDNDSNDDSENY